MNNIVKRLLWHNQLEQLRALPEVEPERALPQWGTPMLYAWVDPETWQARTVLYPTLQTANEAWTANALLCSTRDDGRCWTPV